jgi:hypothetical protein
MLFQPAETSQYMIAGHAIFGVVMFAYIVSIYWRWRNLQRDIETLQELDK